MAICLWNLCFVYCKVAAKDRFYGSLTVFSSLFCTGVIQFTDLQQGGTRNEPYCWGDGVSHFRWYYQTPAWPLFSKHKFYSETCLKPPLIKNTTIGFQYQLSLNEGQKYCRMLQGEHSAILSTFIKLPFVFKTFVLSIFKWSLKTGFNVVYLIFLQYSAQVSSNSLIFNKGALEMNLIGEVMEYHTLDGIIKPVPGHYFLNINSTVKAVLGSHS